MFECYVCRRDTPDKMKQPRVECSDCSQVVCMTHALRVDRGRFVCCDCYDKNEAKYEQYRRKTE